MGKKSNLGVHATKSCGQQFLVEFTENNLPYLKCSGCGHEVRSWVGWYDQYVNMWQDDAAWADAKNNVACVLGYFCHKYRTQYNMDFTMSLSPQGPFGGPEGVFVRRLLANLESSATECRKYIDWFFAKKVIARNRRITSLTPLCAPEVISLYKHQRESDRKIHRSTPLPEKMLEWIRGNAPLVLTRTQLVDFGDLSALLRVYSQQKNQDADMTKFIQELYRKHLITNDLRIKDYVE